ncbi:MAG TPA: Xaa-Pro peptidase family protein [Tepidisphaeraceae bacterium]|nr:Xaa-Pro peptidase family protein [Tepidisphaeraceae bacterium]
MPTTVSVKPKAYLKVRQKAVRAAMKELGLDGILLTHPPDLHYLTNFTGEDSVGLITHKDLFLVTDFRYREQAQIEAGWLTISMRDAKMSDAVAQVFKANPLKRVGFEANYTTVGQLDALVKAGKDLKDGRPPELIGLENVMQNIRKVKDDHEIDLIRKSVALAEEAFDAIRDQIKPGQTENYLAGLITFELRSRGASNVSFPPIVATGTNSALPHYRPSDDKTEIEKDQPCLIDWGAILNGYCSDLTRTFMVGHVSHRIRDVYKLVYESQLAAINFLRPGVTTMQADRVARDVIEKGGYGAEFGHGLGHGLGREIHELPSMRKTGGEEELRPGMVVTVEPGIYIPGVGGVRIEDDVLITHSGCEVLSSLDKTLEGNHIE